MLFFAQYVRRSILNIMSLLVAVGAIHWPSNSGCGDADRSKFVCCVDRQELEVHKVWIWGDNDITTKFHPSLRVAADSWIS